MRILCILLFVAGLAVGVIWPWAQRNFSGQQLGTWALYQRDKGYQTAHVPLEAGDALVRIFVDVAPVQGTTGKQQATVLNLAVSRDGVPVLAKRLAYSPKSGSELRDQPQNGGIIRQSADWPVVKTGIYEFSVRAVEDGLSLRRADLVLRRGAEPVDENIVTAGVVAMVAGLYGFMRLRRRSKA
ncbi:type IV secretion system effector BspB [Pseudochrobactrum sp. HB0163]|uniref:type IV secretion system effector BspB n=1 Tax=Pseudochrobactrum sp. HB0163 TaxID=3450708 RepID=UPI003F6DC796